MRRYILSFLLFTSILFTQYNPNLLPNQGNLGGGLGMTWIDGQPHYTFRLNPEIAFANFGVGLDLNLDFDSNGKLRTENFNEFSDYASIIRYVRYGQKNDPLYVRLGALDYASLGHGTILYMYNNRASFDSRKIGLEFDIDFNTFGVESVYGSFGEAGIFGLRGYTRPLQFTDLRSVPVLGSIEVGATFVTDFNKNTGVTSGFINPNGEFQSTNDLGSLNIIGFDIGIPIVNTSMFNLDLYFDVNKIIDFGSGTALGFISRFKGLGLVDVNFKLERRFNGDNYVPSYFNSLYEIERFKYDPVSGNVTSKIQTLQNLQSVGNGFYGELYVDVLGLFDIIGSYQRLDDYPKSGILHLASEVAPEGAPFLARAGYDKINIQDEKDLFTLDDRSYLFFELGYKPMKYILVSMVYNWTFTPLRDNDDNIIGYEPQKRIEPRVSFIYPFSF